MIQHDEAQKTIRAAGSKMAFTLSYQNGLRLEEITHAPSGRNWLCRACEPFELEILGKRYPASAFAVDEVRVLDDGAQEAATIALTCPAWDLHARLSLISEAEESYTLLLQMGATWPDGCPEEVFMHVPLFAQFGAQNNLWRLSQNPVPKPDGTSAMQPHEEFDLPICNLAPDQKTGFSLELRDYSMFVNAWNQNRNCDLLHLSALAPLLQNRLLLRLSSQPLADVLELRFFALEDGWCEAFSGWRRRVRAKMDLREYGRPDLQWYKKVIYQHFAFAYSREVFNYESGQFEPERLIADGEAVGGYDSILLWYQYPRLGVDERKQWDFNDDIPGGRAGMRDFVHRARAKGVRVFLPYKPWDIRGDETPESIAQNTVDLVRDTDIDGIWFDTMDSVPDGFRERLDAVKPGVLFCTEIQPALIKSIETITGSWDQHWNTPNMPETYILRYLFPENNAPISSRWKVGESKDLLIKRAIFNGTGLAVWQDIFGAWLPFSPRQKEMLKKWKGILLGHFDTYFCAEPIPLYPVLQEGLYANRFARDDGGEAIFSLYNAAEKPLEGPLLDTGSGGRVRELWRGAPLALGGTVLTGRVEPGEVLICQVDRS